MSWTVDLRHNTLEFVSTFKYDKTNIDVINISVGSKSNNVPFASACIFVGRPYYRNLVEVCFGIIMAQPGTLFLVCSSFQLRHAP